MGLGGLQGGSVAPRRDPTVWRCVGRRHCGGGEAVRHCGDCCGGGCGLGGAGAVWGDPVGANFFLISNA